MTSLYLLLTVGAAAVALQRADAGIWGDALCAALFSAIWLACAIVASHKKGVTP